MIPPQAAAIQDYLPGGFPPLVTAPLPLDGFDAMPEGVGDEEVLQPQLLPVEQLAQWATMGNVCEALNEDEINKIGARAVEEYEIDKSSRAEWESDARESMRAVLEKPKPKNHPFENAANIKYPLLTTAALQFAARAYPAIVQGKRPVKAQVWGQDRSHKKAQRAERIAEHMSYQLTVNMPEWETDIDTMLHQMPVIGGAVKKVYWSARDGRAKSEMISLLNIVVNQSARAFETVPRITHEFDLYPYQIEERMRIKDYNRVDIAASADSETTANKPQQAHDPKASHIILEQHTLYDMDGDGLEEPWIVTVHKATRKVLRIQANFDPNGIKTGPDGSILAIDRYSYFVLYPFLPDPNGGFYPIGFGKLLLSVSETINSTLNQLIDAGTLQNAGGGFIGSGLNLKKGERRIQMNRWEYVNLPGQDIRQAIVPHQFAAPSPVLFQLLGMMVDMGKQITSVQDIMTGELTAKTMQPTTLLALIEQGLKVFTAIYKRIYRALKQEFKLLYQINRAHPDNEKYLRVLDWQPMQPQGMPMPGAPMMPPMGDQSQMPPEAASVAQQPGLPAPGPELPMPGMMPMMEQPPSMEEDYNYDDCDVLPVADPNIVTDMQKMAKAQLIQDMMGHPNMNPEAALRRIFDTAAIDEPDELIVPTQPQQPPPEVIADMAAELEKKQAVAAKDFATAQKTTLESDVLHQQLASQDAGMQMLWNQQQQIIEQEVQRRLNEVVQQIMAQRQQIQEQLPDNMMAPSQPQGMPYAA